MKIGKKMLWLGIAVVAVIVGILGVVGVFGRFGGGTKETGISRNTMIKEQPSPMMEDVTLYKDPLGFSFNYPKDATVSAHPEDKVNYANVELSLKPSGTIKFIASDTNYQNIDSWLKKDPEVKLANFLDSKLGSLDAKKVYLDISKKLLIATLWDGMLFKVEITPSDNQDVIKISDKVLATLNVPEKANYTDSKDNSSTSSPSTSVSSASPAPSDSSSDTGGEEVIQ